MSKARELLRSVRNLGILRDLAKRGGGLDSVADLVDNFIDSDAMGVCVQRFRGLPSGAELLEQHYTPFQPNVDQLEQLPEGTLGHAYAGMIRKLNYDPDFFRPRDTSTDALCLTQRIATQIGFPAYVLLNLLASFKAARLKPTELEALSHGNRTGLQAKPLVTQKWEEGWEKPLDQWRQELGVIVAHHPEISANYG